MTMAGTVQNGVIIVDYPERLAEGARVTIIVGEASTENSGGESTMSGLLALAGIVDGLPPDLARNHDAYLHGHPKQ